MRYFTGVGSRETPDDVLTVMEGLAFMLARSGWVLRSGGADGADAAFERGAMRGMHPESLEPWPQIFLPWRGFNDRPVGPDFFPPQPAAFVVAERHHPAWGLLTRGGRMLHARNVHQVIGPDVLSASPSTFLVCWTPGGRGSGGTGQAIRLANTYGVPVFDLGLPDVLARIRVRVGVDSR